MVWFHLIFLFAIGACIGSFLNVVIWRLPRGLSIVFPGSHCPSCGRGIKWYDNIPLLSWLLLGGRCRWCRCRISPRYLVIEGATAVLLPGLYSWYFIFGMRQGAGEFAGAWPMYAAHAALLCGLLACSVVDVELWLIPLEVMWTCSLIGVAVWAGAGPHPFLRVISPDVVGVSLAAAAGLGVSLLLTRWGFLLPSFVDASDRPRREPHAEAAGAAPAEAGARRTGGRQRSVAVTSSHGVDPRLEVLREVVFLLPAIVLATVAGAVLRHVGAAGAGWRRLLDAEVHPILAPHALAAGSALFGYLIGGLWVWATRILGTLGFGKEAMGMGDVHILAAVGAVTGWIVPTIAFFLAPFFALAWGLYIRIRRRQQELPYGPWLAVGCLATLLFYDWIVSFLTAYVTPPTVP